MKPDTTPTARGRRILGPLRGVEARNASWLISETILRLAILAAIDIALARHLQPEGFGTLRFALSTALLCVGITSFGFSNLIVRDLVREPDKRDEILGTVAGMRVLSSCVAVPLALAIVAIVRGGGEDLLITTLLAVALVFDSFNSVDFYLQAELKGRSAALGKLCAVLLSGTLKLLLIVANAPLWLFALAIGSEYILRGLLYLNTYRGLGYSPLRWRFSMARARYMVLLIWPVFFGSAAATLNLRIDQVMLGAMGGTRELGIYAVAARLSEVWYVVPTAIAASVFPAMIRSREQNPAVYTEKLQRVYSLLAWIAIPVAIGTTLIAGPLIRTLFGEEYADAGPMLAIHIWAGPFVFMGALFSRWLTAESMFGVSAIRHGMGAALNIGLNLILIPKYGGMGAAIATLVSYAISNYLACFTYRPTVEAGWMMTRALVTGPFELASVLRRAYVRT